MPKTIALAVAGGTLAFAASGLFAVQAFAKEIRLVIDGEARNVQSLETTVGSALAAHGITVGEHDDVAPAVQSQLGKAQEVSVKFGRPVTVTLDGNTQTYWTTARTVDEALNQLAVHPDGAEVSVPRSTNIPRQGISLVVAKPKSVVVQSAAGDKAVRTSGTVKEALTAAGITPDVDDVVTPALTTGLSDNLMIKFVAVEIKQIDKDQEVPFKTVTKDDDTLAKGKEKVATAGVKGVAGVKVSQRFEDGKLVTETVLSSTPKTEPKDEVKLVGTKTDPVPITQPNVVPPGSHIDWMKAAGIAEADFQYVELLIKRESGWNPNAVNKSSGACGLVQALPCSKLGPNWNDPIVALKWADGYVKNRYSGWAGAWQHSQSTGWY